MISSFLEVVKEAIQKELEFREVEIVDVNRITSRDIGKYFTVYTNSSFLPSGVGTFTVRNNIIFVFVVDKNKYLYETERIARFFLSLKNQSNWFKDSPNYLLEISSMTTANKQYFNLGVELVYIEVVLYTNFQG